VRILLATTEAVPFAKTGGLADVCGALPSEIEGLGHEIVVVMPAFKQIYASGVEIHQTDVELNIPVGGRTVTGGVLKGKLPGSDVTVYFVDQKDYYDREGLYQEDGKDYRDNCERFVFFCRAALELIDLLDLKTDLVHCNDWQTALIPAYLKTLYADRPGYRQIHSVLTIHNLAYQGVFWHWDMLLTGMDWRYFNWRQMEFYGQLNLLKSGIAFADSVSTVSPRYAEEIRTAELGCGLEEILRHRGESLVGILNGVDTRIWNPAEDPFLATPYNVENWKAGKADAKARLQSQLGLANNERAPLLGFVGRLAEQKGMELILETMERWTRTGDAQWVILGTGDPRYHQELSQFAARYSDKVSVVLGFNNELAHKIEAAADIFLMPSRYEPCGLNQMYSLLYGTVPVVHQTGGLADTIVPATMENLESGRANGFMFDSFSSLHLEEAIHHACQMYAFRANDWAQLIETGMKQDLSWTNSARKYVELYEWTCGAKR
jgi:starch synthase